MDWGIPGFGGIAAAPNPVLPGMLDKSGETFGIGTGEVAVGDFEGGAGYGTRGKATRGAGRGGMVAGGKLLAGKAIGERALIAGLIGREGAMTISNEGGETAANSWLRCRVSRARETSSITWNSSDQRSGGMSSGSRYSFFPSRAEGATTAQRVASKGATHA